MTSLQFPSAGGVRFSAGGLNFTVIPSATKNLYTIHSSLRSEWLGSCFDTPSDFICHPSVRGGFK